jgi:hypothetical protein
MTTTLNIKNGDIKTGHQKVNKIWGDQKTQRRDRK